MSKIKSTKRKSTSLLKSESKLPVVKAEVVSRDKEGNNTDNINNSDIPSCSKTSSSRAETAVGLCYAAATNINSNREPSDAFSSYMKNAILEEVLNAKKAALLQSPSVMKLLREEQLKKQRKS